MDYTDSTMAYAYLVGYMDCATKVYEFKEWINEANKIIDRMDIEMNYDQFDDLMDVYNGNGKQTVEIDDITYIIVGEYDIDIDDKDADIGDLYGIVYMRKDSIIELISLADFNKLRLKEDEDSVDIGTLMPNIIIDFSEIVDNGTNKFIIEDGIVFNPPINPVAELINNYKEFLIDKLDIVYKYHHTYGFKDLKLVLELDRFGNDEFWDDEDSDEEDEEDEE
jgi:hypothetical protein